jgi:hypothetical protein
MLPGTYTTTINVQVPTTTPLNIVATQAVMVAPATSTAISVGSGAIVDIRGVTIASTQVVKCGSATGALSALSIRDASMTTTTNGTVLDLARCSLKLSASELNLTSSEIAVVAGDDVVLKADRVRVHGNTSHHIIANGSKRVVMEFTNSLLEDVGFDLNTSDTTGPGSQFTFAEDTFVFLVNNGLLQGCELLPSTSRIVRYENSILAPLGAFDAVNGSSCTFINTLLARQGVPPAGTTVGDPQFVALAGRDFHLKSTSPAIDAALPSSFGLDSPRDLDGMARPQGANPDLGAYELVMP